MKVLEIWGKRDMKKSLYFAFFSFFAFFCVFKPVFAHTINWYADNNIYTTTCESGENVTPPNAPAKYGYTFKEWQPEYILYDYINFTGTQFIDTGIVFDTNTNEIEYEIDTGNYIIGYRRFFGAGSAQNINSITNCSGSIHGTWGTSPIVAHINKSEGFGSFNPEKANNRGIRDRFKLIINKNDLKAWFFVDDELNATDTLANTNFTQNTIWLGAVNLDDPSNSLGMYAFSGNVYYFSIKKDGVLVGEFVPAKRTTDNQFGFYDRVSGNFFENSGTGAFVGGND